MSSQPLASSPVPVELPDWILALKPADADIAELAESAVFSGLDAELELLMQTKPDEVSWLADSTEQITHLLSRDQADAILEGKVKPVPLLRPRRRRPGKLRRSEVAILDMLLILMILTLLVALIILRYVSSLP
jgi:hypothetical protein